MTHLSEVERVANQAVLRKCRNRHARIFIVGCGPSLNKMDLSLMRDEVVITMNRGYLLFPRMGRVSDYWVGVNPLVLQQFRDEIRAVPCPKFVPLWSVGLWRNREGGIPTKGKFAFLDTDGGSQFFTDCMGRVCKDSTVTYVALQLAYHMGAREVYLIGVDHNFPDSDPERGAEVVMMADGPDINHFDPTYFGPGIRWQLPSLEGSEQAYRLANSTFLADDRTVVNAGVDSKLDIFSRCDYRSLFK